MYVYHTIYYTILYYNILSSPPSVGTPVEPADAWSWPPGVVRVSPNLPTDIVDFRGFDSSTILISRGGIPRPTRNVRVSLSQAMLVQ